MANKFRPPKKKIDLILSPAQLQGEESLPSYLFPTQAENRTTESPSSTGKVPRILEDRPRPQVFNQPDYKPGAYQAQLQSIKSYATGSDKSNNLQSKPENKEQDLNSLEQPLSLEEAWSELSEWMKTKGRISLANTLLRKPIINEDQIIEFKLDNSAQEEDILPEKQDILDFLRKKTGRTELQLKIVISKSNELEKKLLGPKEKYFLLLEKNPLIRELKERLDLDIEY